jgi:transglutaminase-like putative cysteine protease
MNLNIRHLTTYRYARPVTLQTHRLVMFPRGSHELRLLSSSLRCTPEAQVAWSQDVFGNVIATANFETPSAELVIESHASIEQCASAWPVFLIAPSAHSYPFRYDEMEAIDLAGFLAPRHEDRVGLVANWARSFIYSMPTDTLSLLKDINNGVLASVTYRTRDEEGTQSPAETLALGSGSCRDVAALFIEAVRHLGIGARAVSGYLYDPDTPSDHAGSTHAWAEVYLPGAGWIAFDPTHQRVGAGYLVPVAVARHNGQIMPVSGGFLGAPGDFEMMDVSVSVTAANGPA